MVNKTTVNDSTIAFFAEFSNNGTEITAVTHTKYNNEFSYAHFGPKCALHNGYFILWFEVK